MKIVFLVGLSPANSFFFVWILPSNCLLLPCPDNADNAGWGKFAKSSLWFHRSCNFGWKLVYIFRYKPDWCGNKLWQVSPYKQHPSEEAGARFVPSVEPSFCAHKFDTIQIQTLFAPTNTIQYRYDTIQIQILFAHTNTIQYKCKHFLPTQIRYNTTTNTNTELVTKGIGSGGQSWWNFIHATRKILKNAKMLKW